MLCSQWKYQTCLKPQLLFFCLSVVPEGLSVRTHFHQLPCFLLQSQSAPQGNFSEFRAEIQATVHFIIPDKLTWLLVDCALHALGRQSLGLRTTSVTFVTRSPWGQTECAAPRSFLILFISYMRQCGKCRTDWVASLLNPVGQSTSRANDSKPFLLFTCFL